MRGAGFEHQSEKRSPKMTANWTFASNHSRGARFHSSAAWLRTRYSSFIAASSPGKCPLVRTARRSLELSASMALVTGMRIGGADVPAALVKAAAYGATIRDRGTGSTKVRAGRSTS